MIDPDRFVIDVSAERVLVCDRRPVRRASDLGSPGLWREVRARDGVRAVFEVPRPDLVRPTPTDGEDVPVMDFLRSLAATTGETVHSPGLVRRARLLWASRTRAAAIPARPMVEPAYDGRSGLVEWAVATADGEAIQRALPSWRAPRPVGEEGAGFTPSRYDLLGFGVPGPTGVVPGRVTWSQHRIAVEMPEVVRLPVDLSPLRRAWVERLCLDARSRFVFVRVGLRPLHAWGGRQEAEAVAAEVDLTGAPPALLERLLDEARRALIAVASRLIATLWLVCDRRIESRVLSRAPAPSHRVNEQDRPRRAPDGPCTVPSSSSSADPPHRQASFPW